MFWFWMLVVLLIGFGMGRAYNAGASEKAYRKGQYDAWLEWMPRIDIYHCTLCRQKFSEGDQLRVSAERLLHIERAKEREIIDYNGHPIP